MAVVDDNLTASKQSNRLHGNVMYGLKIILLRRKKYSPDHTPLQESVTALRLSLLIIVKARTVN